MKRDEIWWINLIEMKRNGVHAAAGNGHSASLINLHAFRFNFTFNCWLSEMNTTQWSYYNSNGTLRTVIILSLIAFAYCYNNCEWNEPLYTFNCIQSNSLFIELKCELMNQWSNAWSCRYNIRPSLRTSFIPAFNWLNWIAEVNWTAGIDWIL